MNDMQTPRCTEVLDSEVCVFMMPVEKLPFVGSEKTVWSFVRNARDVMHSNALRGVALEGGPTLLGRCRRAERRSRRFSVLPLLFHVPVELLQLSCLFRL